MKNLLFVMLIIQGGLCTTNSDSIAPLFPEFYHDLYLERSWKNSKEYFKNDTIRYKPNDDFTTIKLYEYKKLDTNLVFNNYIKLHYDTVNKCHAILYVEEYVELAKATKIFNQRTAMLSHLGMYIEEFLDPKGGTDQPFSNKGYAYFRNDTLITEIALYETGAQVLTLNFYDP